MSLSESVLAQSDELPSELKEDGIYHPVLKKVIEIIGKRAEHIQAIIKQAAGQEEGE